MLQLNPDGILLSPGPGDPALLDEIVNQVKILIGQIPLMGICLGHQIIARALGAKAINVEEAAGVGPAIQEAQEANKNGEVVVIEVRTRQDTRFSAYPELLAP